MKLTAESLTPPKWAQVNEKSSFSDVTGCEYGIAVVQFTSGDVEFSAACNLAGELEAVNKVTLNTEKGLGCAVVYPVYDILKDGTRRHVHDFPTRDEAREAANNRDQWVVKSNLDLCWEELGNVPIDPDSEEIEQPFLHFDTGTGRYVIWHWIEEHFNVSIGEYLANRSTK